MSTKLKSFIELNKLLNKNTIPLTFYDYASIIFIIKEQNFYSFKRELSTSSCFFSKRVTCIQSLLSSVKSASLIYFYKNLLHF